MVQPRDEVGVNRGARGGVVFANRGAAAVVRYEEAGFRHEEVVARQRESEGELQPRDKLGVNRRSGDGVVLANRALDIAEAAVVRHEEVVTRQRESDGIVQPRDEVGRTSYSARGNRLSQYRD